MNIVHRSTSRTGVMVTILVVAGICAVRSDDPALTLACGFVIALTTGLLWRMGESPALLMAAGLQLSQVVTPIFYANALGVPLQAVSIHIGDLTSATWFALVGMLSLVLGIWCGQWGNATDASSRLQSDARSWSPRTAFLFCIITLLLATSFEIIAGMFDGLRQPCLAASRIQWLGVFVLACVYGVQRRGLGYLLLVVCVEVVKGFTGYFGEFKEVFFILLVGLFSVRLPIKPTQIIAGFLVGATLLALGTFWSAVKTDYRLYISEGSKEQVVLAPIEDRLSFLADRMSDVDWETVGLGFDRLLRRLGYLDYLAATMRNVPNRVPFQDGVQIGATIAHVLQPRLLFPDKPPLPSETEVVAKYTGIYFGQSTSLWTSVSLGYLAELYIDFGPFGAFAAMFVLGLVFGRSYRSVCSSSSLPVIVTFGLGVMLATSITQFEQSLIKTLGAFLTTLVVALVLKIVVLPYLLSMLSPDGQSKSWRRGVA